MAMDERFEPPGDLSGEEAAVPYNPEPAEPATGVAAVVRRNQQRLLATDGIEGVAAGKDPDGNDAIVLYLRDEAAAAKVPPTLDGYPVRAEVTGPITAA